MESQKQKCNWNTIDVNEMCLEKHVWGGGDENRKNHQSSRGSAWQIIHVISVTPQIPRLAAHHTASGGGVWNLPTDELGTHDHGRIWASTVCQDTRVSGPTDLVDWFRSIKSCFPGWHAWHSAHQKAGESWEWMRATAYGKKDVIVVQKEGSEVMATLNDVLCVFGERGKNKKNEMELHCPRHRNVIEMQSGKNMVLTPHWCCQKGGLTLVHNQVADFWEHLNQVNVCVECFSRTTNGRGKQEKPVPLCEDESIFKEINVECGRQCKEIFHFWWVHEQIAKTVWKPRKKTSQWWKWFQKAQKCQKWRWKSTKNFVSTVDAGFWAKPNGEHPENMKKSNENQDKGVTSLIWLQKQQNEPEPISKRNTSSNKNAQSLKTLLVMKKSKTTSSTHVRRMVPVTMNPSSDCHLFMHLRTTEGTKNGWKAKENPLQCRKQWTLMTNPIRARSGHRHQWHHPTVQTCEEMKDVLKVTKAKQQLPSLNQNGQRSEGEQNWGFKKELLQQMQCGCKPISGKMWGTMGNQEGKMKKGNVTPNVAVATRGKKETCGGWGSKENNQETLGRQSQRTIHFWWRKTKGTLHKEQKLEEGEDRQMLCCRRGQKVRRKKKKQSAENWVGASVCRGGWGEGAFCQQNSDQMANKKENSGLTGRALQKVKTESGKFSKPKRRRPPMAGRSQGENGIRKLPTTKEETQGGEGPKESGVAQSIAWRKRKNGRTTEWEQKRCVGGLQGIGEKVTSHRKHENGQWEKKSERNSKKEKWGEKEQTKGKGQWMFTRMGRWQRKHKGESEVEKRLWLDCQWQSVWEKRLGNILAKPVE